MGTTQAGRGRNVLWLIAVAACAAWLSWMWSPAAEELPAASEVEAPEQAPAAMPVPVAQIAKPTAPPAPPQQAEAPAPAEPEPPKPERIPTPHPMSLDQTKPPEQFGALAELKKQYQSESRANESNKAEAELRALFDTPNIPSELVQDVSCRRNLCKIEAQWTPRRRLGFSVLSESLKHLYSQRVAIEPAASPSADGSYVTTLYLRLK